MRSLLRFLMYKENSKATFHNNLPRAMCVSNQPVRLSKWPRSINNLNTTPLIKTAKDPPKYTLGICVVATFTNDYTKTQSTTYVRGIASKTTCRGTGSARFHNRYLTLHLPITCESCWALKSLLFWSFPDQNSDEYYKLAVIYDAWFAGKPATVTTNS